MDTEQVLQTARESEPRALAEEPELARHPGPREYVKVAVALAVATAFEVGLYYVEFPRRVGVVSGHAVFVAALLFFAVVKFSLVVLWFMHLRFDAPIFKRMFLAGLVLAITVYVIVLVIFGALPVPVVVALALLLVVLGAAYGVNRVWRGARAGRETAGG
jgi:cytochrome c oxidase subunit 4